MNPFRFKQFEINHARCAQKVGTDGVLLGAWAGQNLLPKSILDVGSGCGLIALMLAQRFETVKITAVEIDPECALEATENATNSPWWERIDVRNTSLQVFAESANEKFDLIVSNPPFFENSLKSKNTGRNLARHTDSLSLEDLLFSSKKLLNDDGELAIIHPAEAEKKLIETAREIRFWPKQLTYVKGTPEKPSKRILLSMKNGVTSFKKSEITIESARHEYSAAYAELLREFLLAL